MQQWNETMQQLWAFLVGSQSEIVIFLMAILVHAVLFGRYRVRTPQKVPNGAGTKQEKCTLVKADEHQPARRHQRWQYPWSELSSK